MALSPNNSTASLSRARSTGQTTRQAPAPRATVHGMHIPERKKPPRHTRLVPIGQRVAIVAVILFAAVLWWLSAR